MKRITTTTTAITTSIIERTNLNMILIWYQPMMKRILCHIFSFTPSAHSKVLWPWQPVSLTSPLLSAPPFSLQRSARNFIFIEKNLEKILSKKDQQLCFAHVLNRWTTTSFLAQNGFWNPESQPETIQISFCHSRSPSHHLYLLFLSNVGVCLLLIAAIKIKMYYSLVVEVLNNHLAVCIVLMLGFYSLLNFSILF